MKITDCAVLLLAAGQSTRFGEQNKLLADFGGRPLAVGALQTASNLPAKQMLVAVPDDETSVSAFFDGDDRRLIVVPSGKNAGMGRSIAAGVQALMAMRADVEGLIILLADMPFVRPHHIEHLAASMGPAPMAFSEPQDRVSRSNALGPPAVFHQTLFHALAALKGEEGARLLRNDGHLLASVKIENTALVDIDTKEDFDRWAHLASDDKGEDEC